MKQIWKFPVKETGRQSIWMPIGAKILSVQTQFGIPCIWTEVETTSEKEERKFAMFGTGHELPDTPMTYIGTFQMADGSLVFHLYEEQTIKVSVSGQGAMGVVYGSVTQNWGK